MFIFKVNVLSYFQTVLALQFDDEISICKDRNWKNPLNWGFFLSSGN